MGYCNSSNVNQEIPYIQGKEYLFWLKLYEEKNWNGKLFLSIYINLNLGSKQNYS